MKKQTIEVVPKRKIDILLSKYSDHHQHPINKFIHWICIPLLMMSLLGLAWSIPFPNLKFLGRYNGTFNWASFLIAFTIYYYYKLSPILSYFMLMVTMFLCYFVTLLEKWGHSGGPLLWRSSLAIFVLAWVGQFIGHKIEGRKPSFLDDVKFLLIGPIWLLHFVLKKLNLKY